LNASADSTSKVLGGIAPDDVGCTGGSGGRYAEEDEEEDEEATTSGGCSRWAARCISRRSRRLGESTAPSKLLMLSLCMVSM